MIIDCDTCEVRGRRLRRLRDRGAARGARLRSDGAGRREPAPTLPSGAPIVQLDAPERRALDVLADQGLVPKLRLVAGPRAPSVRTGRTLRHTSRDVG